jgi:predicted dienelactone hydrolase
VPKFAASAKYSGTVPGTNDPIDVYYPSAPDLGSGSYKLPIIVLVQGGNVDKANYSEVAGQVARHGFVVAIPNHRRTVVLVTGLYPEPASVIAAFDFVRAEGAKAGAPVKGAVDGTRLGLMGHSLGSVTGLDLIAQQCTRPACPGAFTAPAGLKGGVFYGASLKGLLGGAIPATDNRGLGVLLMQGSADGLNAPADAKATYDKLSGKPRGFVTLNGANHYAITNDSSPAGAQADRAGTLAQAKALEIVARWSAMFLRATVADDVAAKAFLTSPPADATVTPTMDL